jgi:prepilin-type N-terminal cleavage/methylation domain-containing protein
MNGKQKGFTLIEILVVVTIIGVLAGLVVVLIPRSQEKAQILECTSNQRNIVGMLVADDGKAWQMSGPNIALYFVKKGAISGSNLKLLFCPGDAQNENLDKAGGEEAYKNLDVKTQQYDHLTSYAGRDQTRSDCVVKQGTTTPEIMLCDDSEDHHNKKGFVCGYQDGSVRWIDKVDDWNMDLSAVVTVGEGSPVKALQCLRAD